MRGMMTYSRVSTLVCIFVLNISLFTPWFKTAHNMKKVAQVISGEPVCVSSASPFLYFAGFNNLKIQQRNSLQRIANLAPKQSVIKPPQLMKWNLFWRTLSMSCRRNSSLPHVCQFTSLAYKTNRNSVVPTSVGLLSKAWSAPWPSRCILITVYGLSGECRAPINAQMCIPYTLDLKRMH